jgi:hypothetical protein
MNAIRSYSRALVRGPEACRMLERAGIQARHYWLLMDLLGQLSDRGELMDQLGRDGIALKTAAGMYAVISAFFSLIALLRQPAANTFLVGALILTTFVLFTVLMSEAGNSLVNPVEGLILAHQPIDGATYTAAKLSHLLRIVLYFVVGMNTVPAVVGLFLPQSAWWYPVLHMLAAFAAGLVAASVCCALFGWLMRFVPAKRLRATAQIAGTLPFLGAFLMQPLTRLFRKLALLDWLHRSAEFQWEIVLVLGAFAIALVALGIRSLSADYLVRVSLMMHGGRKVAPKEAGRSPIGNVVARLFGGPPSRAGFSFTGTMMLRDFQFRRQMLGMLIMVPLAFGPALAARWRVDPFTGAFSTMHLLPHLTGVLLCLICLSLQYGADYKGSWIFLLAPDGALKEFARGVYALLAAIVVVPHLVAFPLLMTAWGGMHAALFVAYSLGASAVYLALTLRLVEGIPFCQQLDPSRGAMMMPLLFGGGICIGLAVGLQWLLFHWPAAVLAAIVVLAVTGWFLTRLSLQTFAVSIRYTLGIATTESTAFYGEINS